MTSDPARNATAPRELRDLLVELAHHTRVDVPNERVEQAAARAEGPWTARLEDAAAAIGLRVRWMVAPLADAVAQARSDLPVVGSSDDGVWWILDGRLPGMVRATAVHDPRGTRWQRVRALERVFGRESRPWGLVEPVLPAAPLASRDHGLSPARRLRALISMERQDVAVVVLYGAVAGLFSLATPLAIQVLINWLAFGALAQPIVLLGGAVLTFLALAAGLVVLQRIAVEVIERRLFVRIVADLAARLARVRPDALYGASGPELANRFFEVLTLQKAAGTLLLDGVTAVLQVTVAVTLLALYHPWLMVFDTLLLLGMAVALIPLGRGAQSTAIYESKAKYAVAGWIEEVARHPLALRQDGARLAEVRTDQLTRAWLRSRSEHFRVFLRQLVGVQALQVAASATLLVASGTLVLRGELTIGQLVAAEFIVAAALSGFAKFTDKLDTVYDLLAGVDKLGGILDLPAEPSWGLPHAGTGPAAVTLEGATLRFPGGGGVGPIDLAVQPGERLVVVGAPGAGKSMLAALVAGARLPSAGAVRRDGEDVRFLRPDGRHRGVVLLRQGDLLVGSIRDNVTLLRPHLTEGAVNDALDAVGLRRKVEAFEDGLDQALDPAGAPLPDQDCRALLVARAMAGRPRLIVVDGLLDGMPAEVRERLGRALADPRAPWTLVVLTGDPQLVVPGARTLTLGTGATDAHASPAR